VAFGIPIVVVVVVVVAVGEGSASGIISSSFLDRE
jgi:hypothetical protein